MGGNTPIKYFIFNKESDYIRGSNYNIKTFQTGITIEDTQINRGVFFSRLLDSKDKDTVWHRLLVDFSNMGESSIHITIYTSESLFICVEKQEYQINEIITNKDISLEEKINIMQPFIVKTAYEPSDMLLHEVRGRYLWMRIELSAQSDTLPEIYGIKVLFPKQTWMGYLPEIYQDDKKSSSFLERFLGIYQSLYEDIGQEISRVAANFDPDVVDGEFLKWLATWLSVDDVYIWSEEKLKYLIKNAMRLYRVRGTGEYLIEIIELYTEKKPYIVEYHQTEAFRMDLKNSQLMRQLYGDSPFLFTIIVNIDSNTFNQQYKTILQIIDHAKPAHVDKNVVILKPYIFLDQYSYLGINSVLGQYRPFQLDGLSSLAFSTIEDKKN